MAAPVTQVPVPVPAADVVGNAFAHQYYHILHQSPDLVHRFYQDGSKFGRPGENGVMSTTTTMNAINEKILSLGYGQVRAEIVTVDSQESYKGGVLVLVTGYLNGNDNSRQKFTQSFFLAPQDNGYFVLNDKGNQEPASIFEAPLTPDKGTPHTEENHISEPTVALSEELTGWEVVADSQVVAESSAKVEDVPKKSYASILKVLNKNAATFSSPTPAPLRSAPKIQEQVTAAVSQPPAAESHVSSSSTLENGNAQESEEGPSIYVKGLPLDATHTLLENEFKKFGPIRNGGIQVRFQKGFCFGFVEFEIASAVQSALEASPIMINGCRVIVEEKRSTSRGNSRGRFSSGSGAGYKSEGMRGRGNLGGKAYGRSDFGNRTEFGNRGSSRSGGYSNRGGDGYSNRGGDGYSNRGGGGGGGGGDGYRRD
ncbi:hypothetical protein OIU77_024273 [Salix suchowensis]|uniref:G3BP-like protein n=1 Tax=Salix suchowensis TaxID=1278906 RepID=A0ABQ9BSC2_9ROSI|nr:hypothetical protein OIU77_024273 [Salix suchowensis]